MQKLKISRKDLYDKDFKYFNVIKNFLDNSSTENLNEFKIKFENHISRSLHRQLSFIFTLVLYYDYKIDNSLVGTQKNDNNLSEENFIVINSETNKDKKNYLHLANASNGKYFNIRHNGDDVYLPKIYKEDKPLRIYKKWINKTLTNKSTKKNYIFNEIIKNNNEVISGFIIKDTLWFDSFKKLLIENEDVIIDFIVNSNNFEKVFELIKDYVKIVD